MTSDAGELLERCLVELCSARAARAKAPVLPEAAAILEAFGEFLRRQEDVYDQILLPDLGLGERFDLQASHLIKSARVERYRGGEIWLFDAQPEQSWLHAPLLIPFEELEDTLVLVRRQDLPPACLDRLRPPVLAGVRQALGALDWVAADTGGYEGGRMEHSEFLEEIGDYPWFRLDHEPASGALRFEAWRGEEPLSGWSAHIFDAFEWDALATNLPSNIPAKLAEGWPFPRGASTFEIAVALDRLHDPYALCQRLILQDAGMNIERLGPLITWKDNPDILVEFTDEDDSLLSDLSGWLAEYFRGERACFEELVQAWFDLIKAHLPQHIPGLGVLHEVFIPPIKLTRPRPLVGCEAPAEVVLPAQRVYAASSRGASDWVEPEEPG